MLLARSGHKVLLVDKATFPSDTISTHLVHVPGVAAMQRWGLKDDLVATGCQPIDTYAFNMGPFTIEGKPGTADEPASYGPRRTVLDKILIDAAGKSGAEVREAFTVEEIVHDNGTVTGIRGHAKGGKTVTENARIVIGADGRHSLVARNVKPEQYNEKPALLCGYYSYWSNLPMNGRFEAYDAPNRSFAAWPTNDDLTLLVGGWPIREFEENKKDVEGNFQKMLDLVPSFAERVGDAKREDRFYGAFVENYFRKPYGPGWALVGDAGYNRDFITAQGISDAFREAELCANAIHDWLSGTRSFDEGMTEYQTERDKVIPMYEFTTNYAMLQPPPAEMQQLFGAIHGNQDAMDGFARVVAGVTSPAEFFSQENIGSIFAAAQARS
jgi:2-polyprenyl-6-methoxyphenol hydroxylase-like FAD-dependent oxidoreductase